MDIASPIAISIVLVYLELAVLVQNTDWSILMGSFNK